MTDREKLIALVKGAFHKCLSVTCKECEEYDKDAKASDRTCQCRLFADHLISNGVTVQRWIPVTERLPEVGADILVCHKNGFVATNAWLGTHWWFKDDKNTITHWMPLPEPPKEGE